MRLSQSFSQTSKTKVSDDSLNAKLLTQAGFVKKEGAGVYSYLPFGFRVLGKVIGIIREEMQAIGGEEVLMPALTPLENWEKTGRADVEIAFRPTKNSVLGWSHEEIITPLAKQRIKSYRDLPLAAYQIQTKFRNEPRAKSGLLRGREFLMKDLYSFHTNQEDLDKYYEKVKQAYFKVFERCNLESYLTKAGGGEFTKNQSHEFQVLTPAGEDRIMVCEKCKLAWNEEEGKVEQCEECKGKLKEAKGAEVGNIFDLGTKYSDAFDLNFVNESGKQERVVMGCYGIGVSRIIAVVAEVWNDEAGLIWPESIAPFQVHLIALGKDEKVTEEATKLYKDLEKKGVEVLFDDRDTSAGEKFGDADLIGIPTRILVSSKTLEKGGVEIKKRKSQESKVISLRDVLKTNF